MMSSLQARYPRLAQFSRDHLAWFRSALIVDWLVVIALTYLGYYLESVYPYERDPAHYLGDNDLTWPHTVQERIPGGPRLDQYTYYLPFAVVVLSALRRLSLHELHHGLLVLHSSRAIMTVIVEFVKNRVSSLRRANQEAVADLQDSLHRSVVFVLTSWIAASTTCCRRRALAISGSSRMVGARFPAVVLAHCA